MSEQPSHDPLHAAILAAAIRALRTRAASRRESANQRITMNQKGIVVIPSEARADLDFASDLSAVADEIEAEGVQ